MSYCSQPPSFRPRFLLNTLITAAALWGGAAAAATIDLYVAAPGQQNTLVPGSVVENFNGFGTGSIGTSGNWAIGTFDNNPATGTIDPFDQYGGAGGTGNYLNVHNGPITVTLQGNRRYVGFWWSAGDSSNQIDFYDDNNNLLVSFTTASLVALLSGNGSVSAVNGTQYPKANYFGNPNPPPNQNPTEPYGYVNLVIEGTTTSFRKIVLRGNLFEVDNISVAATVTPDPTWVPYGSQQITVPAGQIGVNNDTGNTPMNTPYSGSVAGNDSVPAGSSFAQTSNPANGSVVFNANGSYTYTPAPGFSGADVFTYQACKPAPNQTECATATVTITVGVDAVPDFASTTPNTPTSGTSVATNDLYAAGSTFSVVTPPSNGNVVLTPATGAYVYTPNGGFTGTDSFLYRVCLPAPNTAICDTATATINVSPNVAPVASAVTTGGTPSAGVPLTGTYIYSDAESDVQAVPVLRWVRSPTPSVAGGATIASSASYTPTSADAGQYLFFCVTPTAQTGTTPGAEVCSPAAAAVPPPAGAVGIPTLSQWGLILLSALLAMFGFGAVRQRR